MAIEKIEDPIHIRNGRRMRIAPRVAMRMVVVVAVSVVATVASAAITPFRDGERVVFLGDSITAFNHYIADVQFFMDLQRGERAPYFMNCGTAGDAAGPAVDRIACDLMPMRPERVIVMLGMNDVCYDRWTNGKSTPQLEGAIAAYGRNMRVLVDRLLARGLKVDLMTPSPFDEYSTDLKRPTRPGCNEIGLTRLAAHVRALAAEKNLGLVEVHAPMTAIEKAHPTGLHYSGGDRVHPSPAGNRFLAAAVLVAAGEIPESALTREDVEKRFATPKGSDAERLRTAMAPVRKEMERLRALVYCDRFVKGMTGREVDLANIAPAADAVDKWVAAELARGTDPARAKRLQGVKADYRANRTKAPAYQDALEQLHREIRAKWLLTRDALQAGFLAPPASARPHTWYHVMNGNATKAGITKDFEALAAIGIGGVQMFDAGCDIPAGPLAFNTPAWTDFIRHAASEAKRLGLELCLPNCSGWSSSGGPWVTPEDGMKELVHTASAVVTGPSVFTGRLERPPYARGGKADFYRDIVALAVPVPPAETRDFPGVSKTLPGMAALFESETPVTAAGLEFVYRYDRTYGIYGELKVETSADGTTFAELACFPSDPCVMGVHDHSVRTLRFPKPVTFKAVRTTFLFKRGAILEANLRIEGLKPCDRAELSGARMKRGEIRGGFTRDAFAAAPDQVVPEGAAIPVPMAADGSVTWSVPAGRWRLYRLGYRANGRRNVPASKTGEGLEVDKFSAAALGRHFDNYLGRLCDALGPALAGRVPHGLNNVLVDSYEVGSQTWTEGFERTFRARTGYDLAPWYPVFFGKIVGSVDRTERFLEDYRRTLADLFAANYADALAAKCHARGLNLSLEPYGNALCDNLRYGQNADIPMTEFWSHGRAAYDNETGDSVFVPSLAHFWGRRFVAAESFTASGSRPGGGDRGPGSGGWTTTPFAIKALGDGAYAKGVNRIVYHRFVHQPWADVPRLPGMTMGKWGMHFDRTQTWWREGAAWLRYQARCQWMLQEGRAVADFLVHCGEGVPNDCGARSDTVVIDPAKDIPRGYAHDLAGREMLAALTVDRGELVAPSGVRYRALVLPPDETMSLETLSVLERLVGAGATLIGARVPVRVPGLRAYPQAEEDLRTRAARVWARGVRPSVAAYLSEVGLKPDCTLDAGKARGVRPRWIHRRSAAADWYFVCCNNRAETDVTVTVRETARVPELWDAEQGTCRAARRWRRVPGGTQVTVTLPVCGSVFVVFRDRVARVQPERAWATVSETPVTGAWRVAFPHAFKPNALAHGADETLVFPELQDWTNRADTAAFSGSAVYTKEITVPVLAPGERLLLDLGDVREFATVTVNGRTFPALWKPPYRLDITESLQTSQTSQPLSIRITNLWPNKLIADDRKPDDCEWKKNAIHGDAIAAVPEWVTSGKPSPTGRDTFTTWRHWRGTDKPLSSGLLGPVKILLQREVKQ